jgi:hypothetical protein
MPSPIGVFVSVRFPHSGWTMMIHCSGDMVEFGLYWNDKPIPTHVAEMPFDKFVKMIEMTKEGNNEHS